MRLPPIAAVGAAVVGVGPGVARVPTQVPPVAGHFGRVGTAPVVLAELAAVATHFPAITVDLPAVVPGLVAIGRRPGTGGGLLRRLGRGGGLQRVLRLGGGGEPADQGQGQGASEGTHMKAPE